MGEQSINMKGILYIVGLFLLPSISDACLCNGITAATCATAPCTIQCGLCRDKCCQLPFGREEKESEENRWILPCLSGRKEQESLRELDPVIDAIEKESFKVCDMNDDNGLTWEEVSACIDAFGHFFQDLDFPSQEDFQQFDSDEDGVLFYEEWLHTVA